MSKLGKEGQNWHYKSWFKSLKDKKWNSSCPLQNENEPKRGRGGSSYRKQKWSLLGVRESNFSLKIRAIRPSAVFGIRRRTAPRGEGFSWVPGLESFLKLREVGVSPYLGFIPALSTLFV